MNPDMTIQTRTRTTASPLTIGGGESIKAGEVRSILSRKRMIVEAEIHQRRRAEGTRWIRTTIRMRDTAVTRV